MDDENRGANSPMEVWPRMGRQTSNAMQRSNPPPRIALPWAPSARPTQPSPLRAHSSAASSTHSDHSQNPSYYSVSPPQAREGLPTSAPLVRQRASPSEQSLPAGACRSAHFALAKGDLTSSPPPSHSRLSTPSEREHTPCTQHQHRSHWRSDSTDTVRGPPSSTTAASGDDSGRGSSQCVNHPLIPYRDYAAPSTDERSSMSSSPAPTVLRTSSTVNYGEGQKHQPHSEESRSSQSRSRIGRRLVLVLREEDGALLGALPKLQRRLTSISSRMHGTILGLECIVLLMVASALVWITVSKKEASDKHLWAWLWTAGEPLVGALLLLCFAILVTHEVRPLSTVAHLYLQSGVLLLTTLAAVTLMARCLQQESRAVKGVITGCCMWMWVTTFLGFLRAAVIWKVESMGHQQDEEQDAEGDGERDGDTNEAAHNGSRQEGSEVAYGTFTLLEHT